MTPEFVRQGIFEKGEVGGVVRHGASFQQDDDEVPDTPARFLDDFVGPATGLDRDRTEAAALVAGLQRPGFMQLDVPAGRGLIETLGTVGLASAGNVQAMVRGAWPRPAGATVFGLSSQALG